MSDNLPIILFILFLFVLSNKNLRGQFGGAAIAAVAGNITQPNSIKSDTEALCYVNRYDDLCKAFCGGEKACGTIPRDFSKCDINKIKNHWVNKGKKEKKLVYPCAGNEDIETISPGGSTTKYYANSDYAAKHSVSCSGCPKCPTCKKCTFF